MIPGYCWEHRQTRKLHKGLLWGAGNGIYPDLGGGDTYIYTCVKSLTLFQISAQACPCPACPQILPTIAICYQGEIQTEIWSLFPLLSHLSYPPFSRHSLKGTLLKSFNSFLAYASKIIPYSSLRYVRTPESLT